jgi:hypothetical protein
VSDEHAVDDLLDDFTALQQLVNSTQQELDRVTGEITRTARQWRETSRLCGVEAQVARDHNRWETAQSAETRQIFFEAGARDLERMLKP